MGYGYEGLKNKWHSGSVPKYTYSSEAALQYVWQVRVQRLMNQLFFPGDSVYF